MKIESKYIHKKKHFVITIRGNRNIDMSDNVLKKRPHLYIIDKGKVSNNFGSGGFKYYQRFLCRFKPYCKYHKPMNSKLGYIGFHDWADRKVNMGHSQIQCPDCLRYLFKCEFNNDKKWRSLKNQKNR